jgi:hypothetical protein
MESIMIYLFNSGFYPLHRVNLLNTLFLPLGTCNDYRYSKDHLDPALFANPSIVKRHDDCIVVFIDRYGEQGYEFAPIRRAHLLQVHKDADHLYFRVILSDYEFPVDLPAFNSDISKSLRMHGLPQLTAANTTETEDGRYAIIMDGFCTEKGAFHTGDTAWAKAVDDLVGRQAFADASIDPVFVKCRVISGNKAANPRRIFDPARFRFVPGREYSLEFSYRHPRQKGRTGGGTVIQIHSTDNLKWGDDQALPVDSFANLVTRRFTPKRYAEDLTGSLSLCKPDAGFLIPEAAIGFVLRESFATWVFIVLALSVFSIASVLIGIDTSRLKPPYLSDLLSNYWVKLAGAALQTVALFVLFRLIGKKPV